MANKKQLALLKQDVSAFNQWRKENPDTDIDLRGAKLIGADLREAKLIGADLREAKLNGADLRGESLIDADLTNAILTGSRLWETQRAGWIIKGVKCESAFWDREGGEANHYAEGEFERLFAEKTKFVLHYEGGISPLEIATLPSLIQQLEKEHKRCSFRLESIKDGPGGPP